ncbi:hypothetical protein RHSP_46627 [Rhizobium freirei PRF 81]|uniref:Uncharacterized protein n=1 Tax=Rhizobium freirei PRF 81 TaxID=363754 RepID=N6U547_9HYPH|nr:hypothetical protein RHSP_46627 [Rhizobium freirei PRF 81]
MPISARRIRRPPSKWNGLVTTPTVRMPLLRAACATTGAAPVPVPPPMPAVTKHICVPLRWSMISSMHSSAAARPTSGCEPAPRPSVTLTPSWMIRSAFVMVSACASVLATTKSTPCKPAVIMLLTALPPPPPTPNTVIRGLSSVISGLCSLIVIVPVPSLYGRIATPANSLDFTCLTLTRRNDLRIRHSKTLFQPLADTADPAVVTPKRREQTATRRMCFHVCDLRINHQADRRRKSRPLGCRRQTGHAHRTTDADIAGKDPARHIRQTGQLAGAARQDDTLADDRAEARTLDAIANEFEGFLDTSLDDARHERLRHLRRLVTLIFADRRDGNQFALFRGVGERGGMDDLQTLRILDAGGQAASKVRGDVMAAKTDGIGMHQLTFGKDRDRRRAAAHVDRSAAKLDFVVDESGKAACIGCRHHAFDRKMRTVDAEFEVAKRCALGSYHMHVDAESVAEHRQWIADAALAVERVARRQRMQHGTLLADRLLAGGSQYLFQIVGFDFLPAQVDGRGVDVAAEATSRDIDDQAVDREAGHALGGVDGEPNNAFQRIEVGDDAGLDTAGALMTDADDLDVMRAVRQNLALFARRQTADHANDFRRADIENRDDVRPLGR